MKKVVVGFILLFAFILSACTQTLEGDRTPATEYNFATVLTESHYVELDEDVDFSKEESVETARVGEELVFVASHANGPMFVHVRVYDPDGEVLVEEGPIEDWDGLSAKRYVLNVTPEVAGRYHFQMVVNGENGRAFAASPYNLFVNVTDGDDGGDGGDGDAGGDLADLVDLSLTLTNGGEITDGDTVRANLGGFSVNWYGDNSLDKVRLTVTGSGVEDEYSSTAKSGSRWVEFNPRGGDITVSLRAEEGSKVYTKTIKATVEGDGSDDGDDDEGTDASDLVSEFSLTLTNGGEIENGDTVRESLQGFSVNWYVDPSADRVRVTVSACGVEEYSSTSRNGSGWIDFDELHCDDVEVKLRVDEDDDVHIQSIRFEVTSGSSSDRGTMSFDFRVPSGHDADDVWLRLTDDDGDLVTYVDDGDEFRLREDRYTATVVGNDFEIDRVAYDCTRLSDSRLRFDVEDGETLECRVYFIEAEDDTDDTRCEDAVASVSYSGNCYEYYVFVTRSGPDFEMNWDLSTKYDRSYVQLYMVGVGDLYQSTSRSGSHDIDPSDLASGDYEFRVTGYDGSTADLWTVGIRIP